MLLVPLLFTAPGEVSCQLDNVGDRVECKADRVYLRGDDVVGGTFLCFENLDCEEGGIDKKGEFCVQL